MLHIILSLLKIVGMFLLILLGILLLLIIVVLAAPVTYDFSGEWEGAPRLQGKIRWLYHIVTVSVSMKGMQPDVRFSFFGHTPGSGSRKKNDSKTTGKQKKTSGKKTDAEELLIPEEVPIPADTPVSEEASMPENRALPEETREAASESGKNISEPEAEQTADLIEEIIEEIPEEPLELAEEALQQIEFQDTDEIQSRKALQDTGEETDEEETGNRIVDSIGKVRDFVNNPSVRGLISRLWKNICRMVKHLMPSHLWIQARIGTGDPALTGKVMEAAAVLYAFYDNIEIVSEFDEKVLEGRFSVRGWLVPGYLIMKILGMALRILLNRECRAFYKEIKKV